MLLGEDWEIWDHNTRALNLRQLLVNVISHWTTWFLILDSKIICGHDLLNRGSISAYPASPTSL